MSCAASITPTTLSQGTGVEYLHDLSLENWRSVRTMVLVLNDVNLVSEMLECLESMERTTRSSAQFKPNEPPASVVGCTNLTKRGECIQAIKHSGQGSRKAFPLDHRTGTFQVWDSTCSQLADVLEAHLLDLHRRCPSGLSPTGVA